MFELTKPHNGALLGALFVCGCFAGCGKPAPAVREEAVPVRVRAPKVVERAAVISVGGNVDAKESLEIGFQVAGRIRKMLVEEGQAVRAGQLLAELDPADYEFGVAIASGEASAAQAMADKARSGTRKQDLEQAKAAFEQADDEYQRMTKLFERGSLAPNDYKKIQTQWKLAQQRYEEAQEGARQEDLAAAQSKAKQAAANLGLNQKRLSDTKLIAPISGVIARRLADPGEMIGAGSPAVSLMDLSTVRVRVGVPEAEIARVKVGQRAHIRIPSMEGKEFDGRVELIGFAAEPQSRTFAVRVLVPNPGLQLRAGMIAEADIEGDGKVQAITVPGEAVVRDAQGATLVYVYYPEKQRVFARRVQTGGAFDREVQISTGLTAGDRVVVAGQQNMRDGLLVKAEEVSR